MRRLPTITITITRYVDSDGMHDHILGRTIVVEGREPFSLPEIWNDGDGVELRALLKGIADARGLARNPLMLTVTNEFYNCECCGSYVNASWRVTRRGEEVICFYDDGHLGGADDVGDADSLAARVYEMLGYRVILVKDGTLRIKLADICQTYGQTAEAMSDKVDKRGNCRLVLSLDGAGKDKEFDEDAIVQLLTGLNVDIIDSIVVAKACQEVFQSLLKTLRETEDNPAMADHLEARMVSGGAMDDARALPPGLLQRYFGWDDDASEEVGSLCPQTTYWQMCVAAEEAGVEIPEDRKPFGWPSRRASAER